MYLLRLQAVPRSLYQIFAWRTNYSTPRMPLLREKDHNVRDGNEAVSKFRLKGRNSSVITICRLWVWWSGSTRLLNSLVRLCNETRGR